MSENLFARATDSEWSNLFVVTIVAWSLYFEVFAGELDFIFLFLSFFVWRRIFVIHAALWVVQPLSWPQGCRRAQRCQASLKPASWWFQSLKPPEASVVGSGNLSGAKPKTTTTTTT